MCGENVREVSLTAIPAGSPPRVRGKRPRAVRGRQPPRLTPACAGKTFQASEENTLGWAHPRVCGENRFNTDALLRDDGSPPRVRGKRVGVHQARRGRGLTPACAGKTPASCPPPSTASAHPRVCGENLAHKTQVLKAHGSPPRVRGKRPAHRRPHHQRRLTPACAGKTPW